MRRLVLDVCDYNNNSVCNLYDNLSQVTGQATEVFVKKQRNGWKELSFKIPSVCIGENGEEPNFRLDYLIADWRIRVEDDYEVDWYIISEPRITHNAFSKDISIVAGHISQILKTKNLGLEFSNDEGNNVGTARALLDTILEGTGWTAGNVAQFMEDDFVTEKQRSLFCQTQTGAFKMITDMCDLFDAKPIFNGDKTVDIVPMNPFSHVIEFNPDGSMRVGRAIELGENDIPTAAGDIYEIHYDKNMKGVNRIQNTENLVTKLTAYGNYGDSTLGICSLQEAEHAEYKFYAPAMQAGDQGLFYDALLTPYYFIAGTNIQANTPLIWSTFDLQSRSYLWDGQYAHKVSTEPFKSGYVTLPNVTPEAKQNWFSYVMNFSYYDKIGLLTDEMFQEIAAFQREMPEVMEASYNASTNFNNALTRLSEIAESNTGFLKLAVQSWSANKDGTTSITIDKTQGDEGVLYRSDYEEPERKYFTWHVAEKLKENGDSVDNVGSVLYAIKPRTNLPPLWMKCYLRSIDNKRTTRTDIDGVVKEVYSDYVYAKEKNKPSFITVFGDYSDFISTFGSLQGVQFFLFCTNSMTGLLGSKTASDESIIESLKSSTKVVTDTHPTVFIENGKALPNVKSVTSSYAWVYSYYPKDDSTLGDLYFYCTNIYQNYYEWTKVKHGETFPSSRAARDYFFNTKYKTLYYSDGSKWVLMESTEEKKIASSFTKVLYFCLKRDMTYKGLYERYVYDVPSNTALPAGDYAIQTPFQFYWFFTTPGVDNTHPGTETVNITASSFRKVGEEYVSNNIQLTSGGWYNYSFSSEVIVEFHTSGGGIIESVHYDGEGTFQMGTNELGLTAKYIVIYREKLPEVTETIIGKRDCELWVDTENNVVYNENVISKAVEAQFKSYDTISFPSENLIADTKFSKGTIKDNGTDDTSSDTYRSYNIDMYSSTPYEYKLPAGSRIFIYDINKLFTRVINVSGSGKGTFTTTTHEAMIKITYSEAITPDGYYLRVQGYANKLFADDKMYTLLPNIHGEGVLKGINHLMEMFLDASNEAYMTYLPQLLNAQKHVKDSETELSVMLGDMYREGWWREESYVDGDESKLYEDALKNLREISKPETTYEIDFLDLYGSNENDEFYVDESTDISYPDIQIYQAVHLIDQDIGVNLWAYIDDLNKCYDQPWLTTLTINTSLSNIGQQTFTDVMSYIADVAKQTKANESIYMRAANLGASGFLTTDKLNGQINAIANKLMGGSSSWYTDEKGNIIIEAQDGLSAMMLTGAGLLISAGKNADGDWNWRTAATGEGYIADAITAGTIDGTLIRAGTVNTSAIVSNFGQQLDIASNQALLLYATVDGVQPAGGLETAHPGAGDSYVIIEAAHGDQKAHIDIASGGKVNIYGGSGIDIGTGGNLNITAAGKFMISSETFNIDTDGNVEVKGKIESTSGNIGGFTIGQTSIYNGTKSMKSNTAGVYLGTDGINLGGKFKVNTSGQVTASDLNMTGGTISGNDITIAAKSIKIINSDVDLNDTASTANSALSEAGSASSAAATANSNITKITNGTTAVPHVKSTGIEINGDNLVVSSTGKMTLQSNSELTVQSKSKVVIQTNGEIDIGNAGSVFTIGSDGTKAYIKNGKDSYDSNTNGVYIGTDGIGLGKKNFYVTSSGYLTAKGVDISGTIVAESLYIGDNKRTTIDNYINQKGFLVKADFDSFIVGYQSTISDIDDEMSSVTSKTQYMQTDGSISASAMTFSSDDEKNGFLRKAGFDVLADGTLKFYASKDIVLDCDPKFRLATYGDCHIGHFYITDYAIYHTMSSFNDTRDGVYVGTDGIALGGGSFKVTAGGVITFSNSRGAIQFFSGGESSTFVNIGAGANIIHASNGNFAVNWSGDALFAGTVTINTGLIVGGNRGGTPLFVVDTYGNIDSKYYDFSLIRKS